MASGVAAEAILFIGAVIAATALAGVFATTANGLSDDLRHNGQTASAELRSDITIINDPSYMASPTMVLYVKNTGSITLSASGAEVIADGTISQDLTLDVLGSTDDEAWTPGSVLSITVNDLAIGAGDHRVKVTTSEGASDIFEWSA